MRQRPSYVNVPCKRQRATGYLVDNGTRIPGPKETSPPKPRSTLRLLTIPLPSGVKMATCCGSTRLRYNVPISRERHLSQQTVPFYATVQESPRVFCKSTRL